VSGSRRGNAAGPEVAQGVGGFVGQHLDDLLGADGRLAGVGFGFEILEGGLEAPRERQNRRLAWLARARALPSAWSFRSTVLRGRSTPPSRPPWSGRAPRTRGSSSGSSRGRWSFGAPGHRWAGRSHSRLGPSADARHVAFTPPHITGVGSPARVSGRSVRDSQPPEIERGATLNAGRGDLQQGVEQRGVGARRPAGFARCRAGRNRQRPCPVDRVRPPPTTIAGSARRLGQARGRAVYEAATCGNGIVTGAEACDDGNTTSGDGCDSSCNQE
jgi:cysteine-rich repeat protein